MANYSDNLFGEAQLAFLQDFTRVLQGVRRGSLKGFLKVRYKRSVVGFYNLVALITITLVGVPYYN